MNSEKHNFNFDTLQQMRRNGWTLYELRDYCNITQKDYDALKEIAPRKSRLYIFSTADKITRGMVSQYDRQHRGMNNRSEKLKPPQNITVKINGETTYDKLNLNLIIDALENLHGIIFEKDRFILTHGATPKNTVEIYIEEAGD